MEDLFTGYNWTGLTLLNAEHLITKKSNEIFNGFADTQYYQLGAKFVGDTKVEYDGKKYDYSSGVILYLPKESKNNVPYNRHIRKCGEGACIFFDSMYQLPPVPAVMPLANHPQISRLFIKTAHYFNNDDRISSMISFYQLISKVREESMKLSGQYSMQSRLYPAIEYINEHICDYYIDVTVLSEVCKMTPEYFRHQFKRAFRITPHQYINNKRIALAKKLLLESECQINELASQLGFGSANYFSRFFKEHTGTSPLEYRVWCRNVF